MKKIFFLFLSVGLFVQGFSQSNHQSIKEQAKQQTEKLVKNFGLSADQEAKMQTIQERKFQNAADFSSLAQTDEKLFYQKKKANMDGTKFSIERLLNTTQMKIYKKEQENLRLVRMNKIKEFQSKGISGFELEKAIIDLDY